MQHIITTTKLAWFQPPSLRVDVIKCTPPESSVHICALTAEHHAVTISVNPIKLKQ